MLLTRKYTLFLRTVISKYLLFYVFLNDIEKHYEQGTSSIILIKYIDDIMCCDDAFWVKIRDKCFCVAIIRSRMRYSNAFAVRSDFVFHYILPVNIFTIKRISTGKMYSEEKCVRSLGNYLLWHVSGFCINIYTVKTTIKTLTSSFHSKWIYNKKKTIIIYRNQSEKPMYCWKEGEEGRGGLVQHNQFKSRSWFCHTYSLSLILWPLLH